ncbi:PilT/PilU family type 4a pilus ATPase [uncultured Thiodictyon sp.]|jgi:twitching motility protein PilU|uniref:PilT/PilU family type 4a pilus ATPase n=1 Tax=uncultured Thiodictyon sp. TaxID=1846217 RepID=UPI0025FAC3A2|nr:PilT/PilU family type 4a pilus ATPase [uncultured Thiodictyon sp.]
MDRQEATKFMLDCLRTMLARNGSDLFITADFPPACKIDGRMTPLSDRTLSGVQTSVLVRAIMNDRQVREYEAHKECNFAISPQGIGRFRVNAFIQQGLSGAVLRTITSSIPELDDLNLPPVLKDLIMTKRGLILVVGGTGSGKSTSLAAMIGHRNKNSYGHIITIEDPVEYVHPHRNCLITQREVGVDTEGWDTALMNTLRQAPDVILIGEIRARETMEHAINFAETGHLCLSTLHANSANQALDRIINLFPEERRVQLLMDLSLNLKAVISQRLLPCSSGGRIAAIEIMINSPLIQDLIFKGDVHGIKGIMKKSRELGMQTFDMALFALYEAGKISYEDALRSADSMNELRLAIKLEGHEAQGRDMFADVEGYSIVKDGEDLIPDVPLFGAPPPRPAPPSGATSETSGGVPFGQPETSTGLAVETTGPALVYQAGVRKERSN